jgi:hypothetical protein
MNFTTIITGVDAVPAMKLVCLIYCADYLHARALITGLRPLHPRPAPGTDAGPAAVGRMSGNG